MQLAHNPYDLLFVADVFQSSRKRFHTFCFSEQSPKSLKISFVITVFTDHKNKRENCGQRVSAIEHKIYFPVFLTLIGNESPDSKTLVLQVIKKHYPPLLPKYEQFFRNSNSMPAYYLNAFELKMNELLHKYNLRKSII